MQRSLKFVRYLPDHGWMPTVISVKPESAAWPAVDPSMLVEIPEAVKVVRTPSRDPYAAYARFKGRAKADTVGVGFADAQAPGAFEHLARFVRANLFLPDARRGWVRFAKKAVRECLENQSYDAVVTSGPPHSTHFVGRWAQREFGIPWLADFRDPWTEVSYYDQLPFLPWSRWLDRRWERGVLSEARSVVTVSEAVAALLREKSSRAVSVIPNGFDPEDLAGIEPRRGEGFRLVHTGTLAESQNPEMLWPAVRTLRDQGLDLRIHCVGRVDASVRESIRQAGLEEAFEFTPYVPHREALRYMAGADCLLMCVPRTRESAGILTGKVFEYLASGRPVLGIGPPDSDPARLIAQSGAGIMVAYTDPDAMRAFLHTKSAAESDHARPDPSYLEPYTRQSQAGTLAGELNRIAE
ncbi:MAG: glycosyltransferase [Rhodothermales bacterium]|nr:glycosyltransferase [Rhodothermales bacterium]